MALGQQVDVTKLEASRPSSLVALKENLLYEQAFLLELLW
jgi:hypothetical protein